MAFATLATFAAAASTESVTLVHKWKAGDTRVYAASVIDGDKTVPLGEVTVKVLKVEPDGSAQVEMQNDKETPTFTFTFGDHGKITKDPGGKQGIAGGLSLLFVLPKGSATIGQDVKADAEEYGFTGSAMVKVEKDEKEGTLLVVSKVVPDKGTTGYAFLTTYLGPGGLPVDAALMLKEGDDKPTFVRYTAKDVK